MDESCLLYTSDAADERSSVDLGGRRIIKKKNTIKIRSEQIRKQTIQIEEEKMNVDQKKCKEKEAKVEK